MPFAKPRCFGEMQLIGLNGGAGGMFSAPSSDPLILALTRGGRASHLYSKHVIHVLLREEKMRERGVSIVLVLPFFQKKRPRYGDGMGYDHVFLCLFSCLKMASLQTKEGSVL